MIPLYVNWEYSKLSPIEKKAMEENVAKRQLYSWNDNDLGLDFESDRIKFTPDQMIRAMESLKAKLEDAIIEIEIERGYYGEVELRIVIN